MTQIRRLLLLLPLALALALSSGQGRAQTTTNARFAFADTTLLRDTLNLTFERLFPLADSLQVLPDSLRAWSIRYRYPLDRLLALADSLAMPVDSVGPVLWRERFNPLASGSKRASVFNYRSTYSVGQRSNSWVNGADVSIVRGPLFVSNTTDITLDNYGRGSNKSFQETRKSQNEAGWKLSPNLSIGGRALLDRLDNTTQGAALSESETKGEYSVSVRTRQQMRGITSELNFFGGALDVNNRTLQKSGLQHELNGRIRFSQGSWLTHDLQGQLNGNFSNSNAPAAVTRVDTRDRSQNLRGTLGLFNSSPASLNVNYNLKDIRVQNPAPAESLARGIPITEVVTEDRGLDMTVRLRRSNDIFLNLTQRFSNKEQASSVSASAQNARDENGFTATGRYGISNRVSLDASFSISQADSRFPRRSVTGGYDEDLLSRSVSATLNWTVTQRMIIKSIGNVSLSSNRYAAIDQFDGLPPDRDSYRQSYRSEALYNRSDRFNTTVGLEVARILGINLPAASAAANNELRTYRADWRWSYRLSQGLTATQRNLLSADYTYYRFSTSNRLTLDYSTYTTLNAVLTPRLQLDVNHSARFQPSGNLVRIDGIEYLQRADENNTYTLDARMSYTPFHGLSLNIRPQYVATNRDGTVDGQSVPQRRSRMLQVQGGASLDIPVGRRGSLAGDINRSFHSDQSTAYTLGNPRLSPVNEDDFWQGTLAFQWQL